MTNKVSFTAEELENIEVGMKIAKKAVVGFARSYDGLDTGALEGEVIEYLMKVVKKYDPDKNDNFKAFVQMCISNKLRNLKKLNKYVNFTNKHCVSMMQVDNEGESFNVIDDVVQVPDVADDYIAMLDKQAYEEAKEQAMSDIYSGATTEQLKIVKMYLNGMTMTEIARTLNFSHHSRVYRELKKLRKVIKLNPFAV